MSAYYRGSVHKSVGKETIWIMNRLTAGIVIASVAIACFIAGGALNEKLAEPGIMEVPVEVEVVKWKEPEKEVIYLEAEPVIRTEEVVVEVPVGLRGFESTEELESWLAENHINEAVMLYAGGKEFDCDDYARRLIKDARADGYQLWFQVLLPNYQRSDTGKRLTDNNQAHALCSAIIGNKVFFIEPQTDEY